MIIIVANRKNAKIPTNQWIGRESGFTEYRFAETVEHPSIHILALDSLRIVYVSVLFNYPFFFFFL